MQHCFNAWWNHGSCNPCGVVKQVIFALALHVSTLSEIVDAGDITSCCCNHENQTIAAESMVLFALLSLAMMLQLLKTSLTQLKARDCAIISTPRDTLRQLVYSSCPCLYVRRCFTDDILKFSVNTAIDDARKAMTNSRHRFPVINENGTCWPNQRSWVFLNPRKKHVILVDHNEHTQAVDGLEQVRSWGGGHRRISSVRLTQLPLETSCYCTPPK